jgi:hypothetical protein
VTLRAQRRPQIRQARGTVMGTPGNTQHDLQRFCELAVGP